MLESYLNISNSFRSPQELAAYNTRLNHVQKLTSSLLKSHSREGMPEKYAQLQVELSSLKGATALPVKNAEKLCEEIETAGGLENWQSLGRYLDTEELYPQEFPLKLKKHTGVLTQVIGDVFLGGTSYEGSSATPIVGFISGFLSHLNPEQASEIFGSDDRTRQALIDNLEFGLQPDSQLESSNLSNEALSALTQDVMAHLKTRMDSGKSCFLMGGWVAPKGDGHAVYYEVSKQTNGKYTFRFFNRGGGLEYLNPSDQDDISYYPAMQEIYDIEEKNLFQEDIWRSLIELRSNVGINPYNAIDLFDCIFPLLGGKVRKLNLHMEDLLKPQHSGTCTWKSLSAYLRIHLSFKAYKTLKYRIKQQAFWEYTHAHLSHLKVPSEEFSLYQRAFESFVHAAGSALQQGVISQNEYEMQLGNLALLEKEIVLHERQQMNKKKGEAPRPNADASACVNWSSGKNMSALAKLVAPSSAPVPSVSIAPFDVEAFEPDTATFLNRLDELNTYFKAAILVDDNDTVVETYRSFLQKLPLPVAHADRTNFWQKIDPQQAIEIFTSFEELYELFIMNYLNSEEVKENKPTPQLLIDGYQTTCIIDALLMQASKVGSPLLGIDPLPDYCALSIYLDKPIRTFGLNDPEDALKQAGRLYFLQFNPQQRQHIQSIYTYLEARARSSGAGRQRPFAFESTAPSAIMNYTLEDEKVNSNGLINPECEFFRIILNDKTLLETYLSAKPHKYRDHHTNTEKIAFMMEDRRTIESLYPVYNRWSRACILTGGLVKGGLDRHESSKSKKDLIDFNMNRVNEKDFILHYGLFSSTFQYHSGKFVKQFNPIKNRLLSIVLHGLFPRKLDENGVMKLSEGALRQIAYKAISGMRDGDSLPPLDEVREWCLACINPSVQVYRLIALFGKKRELLRDEDFRTFFTLLFFEKTILSDTLKQNPEAYAIIHAFILSGYRSSETAGDISSCLFYLTLAGKVAEEFGSLLTRLSDNYEWKARTSPFVELIEQLNGFDEIEKLLSNPQLTLMEQSKLYAHFLATCNSSQWKRNDRVLTLCGQAIGHLSLYPLTVQEQDPQLTNAINSALKLLKKPLEQEFRKDPQAYLQNMLTADPALQASLVNETWDLSKFPVCRTTNGQVQLHALTGQVLRNDFRRAFLPAMLQKDTGLAKIYPPASWVDIKGWNTFAFIDIHGHRIEITTDDACTKVLSLKRTTPEGAEWILQTTRPVVPCNAMKTWTFWYSPQDHTSMATPKIERGYQKLALFHYRSHSSEVERVEMFPSADLPEKCLVVDVEKSGFEWLKKIEDMGNILLLASPEGKLKHLFLQTLDLSFDAIEDKQGNIRWMSRQQAGFYLETPQYVEVMEKIGLTNYLVLRNKKGEQQVVLKTGSSTQPCYYTYSYKLSPTKDQRLLIGNTPDANLHLAHQAYLTHTPDGYSMALGLLRPEISIGAQPSPNTRKLAAAILVDSEKKRSDPMAVGLTLRSAFFCKKIDDAVIKNNALKDKRESILDEFSATILRYNELFRVNNALGAYVDKYKRLGQFALDEEVEFELMQMVENAKKVFTDYVNLFPHGNSYEKQINGLTFAPDVDSRYKKLKVQFGVETWRDKWSSLLSKGIPSKKAGYLYKSFLQKPFLTTWESSLVSTDTTSLLTRPDQGMKTLFKKLFPHALKSEKDPHKIALRRFLRLAKNDADASSNTLRFLLEEVCNSPRKYRQYLNNPYGLENALEKFLTGVLESDLTSQNMETHLVVTRPGSYATTQPLPTLTSTRMSPASYADEPLIAGDFAVEDALDADTYKETVPAPDDSWRTNHIEERLKQVLSKQVTGTHLRSKEYERLENSVVSYADTLRNKPKMIDRWDMEKIPELIQTLEPIVNYRRQKGSVLREELLQAINLGLYTSLPQASYIAGRLEKNQNTLTILDVLIIHGRKEHLDLTNNDPVKAQALAKDIQQFLDYVTKTQKYERSFAQLMETQSPKRTSAERERLSQRSLETFLAPGSDGAKYPARQVIEYILDLSIRKDQADVLDMLDKGLGKKGLLMQADPGFGKTTLILPLYALLCANGVDLSMCVVPDQMLAWICEELESRIGPIFGIWLRSWNIAPAPNATAAELGKMFDFLDGMRKNKQALIIGAKAAHCLNIQIDRSLTLCCRGNTREVLDAQTRFEILLDIEQIFQEKSRPIGDESHIWLNTRREVNSASGELCRLPDEEQLAITALYDILLSDQEMVNVVRCEFDPIQTSTSKPFTAAFFGSNVKETLVEKLLTLLSTESLWSSKKAQIILSYFQQLSKDQKDLISTFLMDDRKNPQFHQAERFVEGIVEDEVANVIYLLAEELSRLLPATAVRKCDENYVVVSRIAIPAHNGMPLVGSEFGNPHETGNYTMQSLIKHGIPSELVKKRIDELQEAAILDLKFFTELSQTPSYKAYCALCPSAISFPLFRLKPADYESLTTEINSNQKWRREFLLRYVLPQIEFYTSKFNSNCYRLSRLLPNMRAITGTMATNYAYASWLALHPSKGADARTLFTLYSHCVKQKEDGTIDFINNVLITPDETPESLFNVVQSQLTAGVNLRLLPDAGGFLNGSPLETLVPEWKAKIADPAVQAICYHREGKLVVYSPAQPQGIPLKQASFKPQNRLTVLLQPYVTGTDTIQANDAVVLVTFSPTTSFSLLVQAVWRGRQIHERQSVMFCASENTCTIIRQALGLSEDAPVTFEEIFQYSLEKEIQELGLDNEAGARLGMLEYVQHLLYKTIKTCRQNRSNYSDLFIPEVADLLEQHMPRQARDQYKGSLVKDEPAVILEQDVQKVFSRFKAAWDQSPTLQSHVDINTVEAKLRKFIRPDILPEELETRTGGTDSFLGQEVTVTTEKTKEIAKQLEVAQEVSTESDERPDSTWHRLPWDRSLPALHSLSTRIERFMHAQNVLATPMKSLSKLPGMGAALKSYAWTIGSTKLGKTIASVTHVATAGAQSLWTARAFNQGFSYPLKDFIATSSVPEIAKMAFVWEEGLNISFNAAPSVVIGIKDRIAQPFDSHHKHLPFAILRQQTATGRWELDLLDQTDAEFFMERLQSYRAHADLEGWECVWVDLANEFYIPGPGELTQEKINESKKANRLLSQAKFYNAIFSYTDSQNEALVEWMEQHGKVKMQDLFNQSIVRHSYQRLAHIDSLKRELKELDPS